MWLVARRRKGSSFSRVAVGRKLPTECQRQRRKSGAVPTGMAALARRPTNLPAVSQIKDPAHGASQLANPTSPGRADILCGRPFWGHTCPHLPPSLPEWQDWIPTPMQYADRESRRIEEACSGGKADKGCAAHGGCSALERPEEERHSEISPQGDLV